MSYIPLSVLKYKDMVTAAIISYFNELDYKKNGFCSSSRRLEQNHKVIKTLNEHFRLCNEYESLAENTSVRYDDIKINVLRNSEIKDKILVVISDVYPGTDVVRSASEYTYKIPNNQSIIEVD